MNYLKFFLITIFISTSIWVKGQTELEIKTKGTYLYSWAIEKNEKTARKVAKLGLLDTIFVSLLKEDAIDQTDTTFNNVIDYFVKKVGFKWQAIAFADKSEVKVKLEQRKHSNDIDLNNNIISKIKTGNPTLDELLALQDSQSLEKQLLKFRAKLKLNFGERSNYPDDSGCYIFVINEETKQIAAVYDKGKGARRNFLTNLTESDYFEKFKGNMFIYVVIN